MKMKKMLAGLLAAAMVVSGLPTGMIPVQEAEAATILSEELKYEMNLDGNLDVTSTAADGVEATLVTTGTGGTEPSAYSGSAVYVDDAKDGQAINLGGTYGLLLDNVDVDSTYTVSFYTKTNGTLSWASPACLVSANGEEADRATWMNDWIAVAGYNSTQYQFWSEENNWQQMGIFDAKAEWTHYVICADASGVWLYENGELIGSGTATVDTTNGIRVMLGANYWDATPNNYIDEVKIYDATLTAEEVQVLYNSADVLGEVIVEAGKTVQLNAVESEEITYAYTTSNEQVATVDADGQITAVGIGVCQVTATAYWNGIEVGRKTTPVTVSSGSSQEDGDTETESTVVPDGVTTFVFDEDVVTVKEGTDTNYTILNKAGDAVTATGTDADGNSYYTAATDDIVAVEIGKAGGAYAFEGTTSDSNITVAKGATADATLYLNGLDMASTYTAPLVVKKDSTAAVYILAVDGTTNKLSDAEYNNDDVYTDNADAENAVIKAKDGCNVIIGGTGSLEVDGNGKNGIKAATSLTIQDLNLSVSAPNNGIASDTEMLIKSGTIFVEAENDGIKSSNDDGPIGSITIEDGYFIIDTVGDCITATMEVNISGGNFDLTAYGGYDAVYDGDDDSYPSAKGIKASGSYVVVDETTGTETEVDVIEENQLNISGGSFIINTADDSLHSDGDLTITGGTYDIKTGDDAVHSDYNTNLGVEGAANSDLVVEVGAAYEGIEGASVTIYSGEYTMYCSDDIINAANADLTTWTYEINIYGGNFYGTTYLGDGYDSNANLNLYGGTHVILSDIGLGENNEPLDCDGTAQLSGATVLGIGRAGMGIQMSNTNAYVTFGSSGGMGGGFQPGQPGQSSSSSVSIATGSTVAITDASGNTLIETVAEWDETTSAYSASYVIFSSPTMTSGSSYNLLVNGTQAATGTATGGSAQTYGAASAEPLTLNVTTAAKPEITFRYECTSQDTQIATVSEDGVVTGVAEGTTTVVVIVYANDVQILAGTYEVQVTPSTEEPQVWPFVDVAEGTWYYAPIEYVYYEGIMTGMDATHFAPMNNLNRAQFALILYRMEGSPEVTYTDKFSDVPDGTWYTKAVLWAAENGIVTGYGTTGTFGPDDNITREQLAVMMYRYASYKNLDVSGVDDLSGFPDAGDVTSYAVTAMGWAVENGIITGSGGNLKPLGTANRAECASIIQRYMNLIG